MTHLGHAASLTQAHKWSFAASNEPAAVSASVRWNEEPTENAGRAMVGMKNWGTFCLVLGCAVMLSDSVALSQRGSDVTSTGIGQSRAAACQSAASAASNMCMIGTPRRAANVRCECGEDSTAFAIKWSCVAFATCVD